MSLKESSEKDYLLASTASQFPSTLKRPLQETGWRWVALILMNLLVFGDFVAIDNPQPLQTQMMEILDISEEEYSLLYGVWAIPSIIVPLFGGFLTDKLGVRPAVIFFSFILTIGQFIYAFAGYYLNFNWMLIGRAVYAIGSDPLNVAQIVLINKWFFGQEIGLAMALGTATCGMGRAVNSFLVPKLFEMSKDLFTPMLFSAFACLGAAVVAVFMVILDKINDKQVMEYTGVDVSQTEGGEKISMKDIKHFRPMAWLLIFSFGLTNAVFFSFNAFTNDLYFQSYHWTNAEAGVIISISFVVTAVSTLIFGKVVDKFAWRASLIMYSSFLGLFAFIYFLAVPTCDACLSTILPQVFFGLLIGVNDAATFPSLPLVLEDQYLGTGYGLFFVVQNVLVLVFPTLGAIIKENTASTEGASDGYFWMLVFFTVWMVVAVMESFALWIVDKKNGRILDKTIITEENADSIRASLLSNAQT